MPSDGAPSARSLRAVRRSWLKAIPVVVAIAVVGTGAALGFGRVQPPVVPTSVRVEAGAPQASSISGSWKPGKPPSPTAFDVADATGGVVHLYERPDVPLAAKPELVNPTWEGLPVVFLVLAKRGGWLHVRVSSRPNDLTAWVRRSEVSLRTVPNRVLIEVGARRVTVLHGDAILLRGWCEKPGAARVGLGECWGTVLPAR